MVREFWGFLLILALVGIGCAAEDPYVAAQRRDLEAAQARAQQAAYIASLRDRCVNYGFTAGTDGFARCMQSEARAAQAEANARQAEADRALNCAVSNNNAPGCGPRRVRCSRDQFGNVNCVEQ